MPEVEGCTERICCVRGIPGSQCPTPVLYQLVEAVEIELSRLDPQLVGTPTRDQHTFAQEPPQL